MQNGSTQTSCYVPMLTLYIALKLVVPIIGHKTLRDVNDSFIFLLEAQGAKHFYFLNDNL